MTQPTPPAWDSSLLIPRALSVLQGLPVADQWEITRRHPYYLLYWEDAQRYQRQQSRSDLESELGFAATFILYLIGVTRDYPPPSTEAVELTKGMLPAWLNGAIAPLTYRAMAAALITGLSPACREVIAALREVQSRDPNDTEAQLSVMTWWLRLESPELDSIPAMPAVSINLEAPLEDILKAVETQVKSWKRERQVPKRRRREDKVKDYLKVWDQREGWVGDGYDPRREMSLLEIARATKCSVETIRNRYQAAFRLIVGHDYSPELWDRLFAAFKLNTFLEGRYSPRRPRTSRQSHRVQIISETDLQQPSARHRGATLIELIHSARDSSAQQLLSQIRDLIRQGWDNPRIIKELALESTRATKMLKWVKSHPDSNVE